MKPVRPDGQKESPGVVEHRGADASQTKLSEKGKRNALAF